MKIRVGIIGAGNISETHARAVGETEGAEVVAVYGQNGEKSRRLAQLYGGAAYDDLESFLAHPMEMVAIGSPSGLHAKEGIAAAQRGLHVLVEKPIDISTARADALIETCDAAGVKLGVFFQDRVAPGVYRLKKLVDEGRLGRLILASARVKWFRPVEYYADSRWRGTWALDGGGALMNQGVHTVDLLLWLLGDVSRVYARATTALHDIEVEDTVAATLEFASGAVGTLEATTAAYPGYPRQLELTGTEGTCILHHDQLIATDLRTPPDDSSLADGGNTNASASSPIVSDVRGHQKILEDFIRAIETDRAPLCNGREGRRSVELIEAIYKSSREGRVIEF
ncbi:MAG: Gfo/Idh/MocA family oxidoreductase [Acidobacteriota bacterium]|nr:Gfo/Idh/MocA family oxidoreductase [Acidobacteriota bacterium]